MHRTNARRRHPARTLTIEIRSTKSALDEFRRAFKALAAGQRVPRHDKVSVVSMQAAWNLLTRERLALLRVVRSQHPDSIEDLAQVVGRHPKHVHRDLRTLEGYGLILMSHGRRGGTRRARLMEVPFDAIALRIAI